MAAAASSYVRDRFEKNVSRKIVVYGMLIPIYKKISVTLLANMLFRIPHVGHNTEQRKYDHCDRNSHRRHETGLNHLVSKEGKSRQHRMPRVQIRISSTHDTSAYSNEFMKNVATPPEPHMPARNSQNAARRNFSALPAKISAVVDRLAASIHPRSINVNITHKMMTIYPGASLNFFQLIFSLTFFFFP